jgi:hypothetical protein
MALLMYISVTSLAACGHNEEGMQAQLNDIRVMVKQSALLVAQAACIAPESRADVVLAAVTLLRRGMGGQEMASVHKMMGQMPDDAVDGSMTMMSHDRGQNHGDLAMQLHVAIHDAGEDVFELLDALGGSDSPTCGQVQVVGVAAAAALLREYASAGSRPMQQRLQQRSRQLMQADLPDTVKQLVDALARI